VSDEHWILTLYDRYVELYGDPDVPRHARNDEPTGEDRGDPLAAPPPHS
jgi:hypothetical protein